MSTSLWTRINRRLNRAASQCTGKVNWNYRLLTSGQRRLPDFVIVGAQKSGTTSLYSYLAQHPRILPPYKKEVHFFDGGIDDEKVDNFNFGEKWYRAHFALASNRTTESKAFEASPLYLFNPLVPKRMHGLIPDARIIAVLRNPTERAISHYFHVKGRDQEPLSIEEALAAEDTRLEPCFRMLDFKADAFRLYSYKSRGLYKEQIERFLEYFPRERVLVIGSENMFLHPHETMQRVFEFVGVDSSFVVGDLEPRNVGNSRAKVSPSVYEFLNDYYRIHNEELFSMLGEDFGWNSN